jgi:hypothetical protein
MFIIQTHIFVIYVLKNIVSMNEVTKLKCLWIGKANMNKCRSIFFRLLTEFPLVDWS